MPISRVVLPLFVFAVFAFAAGCGGPKEAEVSGVIRFEGQPVEKGAISFFPIDGKSPTSGAEIRPGGEYKSKVPYGEMTVRITSPKVVGKRKLYANDPKSPEMDLTVEALPLRYNEQSELKITINEPLMKKDFDLKK